jgi:hypothetical protein
MDLLGFRGADAFGAEGRVWISQVTPREVVRCAESAAPIGTGNTQSTIQWPKSSRENFSLADASWTGVPAPDHVRYKRCWDVFL